MTSGLKDKNVLVVGASSGIGAAVARRFGGRGARLIVHYNSNESGAAETVAAIRDGGGWAKMLKADVSDRRQAAEIVDRAVAELGGLDVLINNAGTMFGRTAVADATDQQYDDIIDLNIGSVFFASRRAARLFRETKTGSIINTTSIAARTGGSGGAGIYGSAKAFVSNLTRVLARELAPFGIRVNAVAPGVILTPFHERYSTPEQLAAIKGSIPLGRLGTPEDCVGAFEFLADDRMSAYITGQIIEVNGGQLMP
jgi:3-oxoacyl-[acyl-carrier protein] reductase